MNFSKDSIAIKSLTNALKTNKLSHAYLMVGEDSLYCDEFILQFVKSIFCLENNYKEFYNCGECKACQSIEHNNYVDFYIIESETSIKKEEPHAVMELFQESGAYRNSMDSSAQGLIHSDYALSIRVQDHPGAISIISTILASNMVSIRNIGINHNREKGEGALQLSFYTGEDCEMAKKLLHKYGFIF